MPSQNGTANSAVAAGTQPISSQMPGMAVGGRTSPRPPMPMGGGQGGQGGGPPQPPQQEPRLPVQPNAGGPTSPMNIGPTLTAQQTSPSGGGQTPLPAWGGAPGASPQQGNQGAGFAGVSQGPDAQQGGAPFGPAMMLQLMKSMGRI